MGRNEISGVFRINNDEIEGTIEAKFLSRDALMSN